MAWKLQEGPEEPVLAQPCALAGPDAGHAGSEAAGSVLPAVPLSVCLAVPSPSRRFPVAAAEAVCSCWACPCLEPVQVGVFLRGCVGQRHALRRESQAPGVPVPWPWFLAIISRFSLGCL